MNNKTLNSLDKPNKNSKIQILRAVAIMAVIVIHTYPLGIWGVFIRPFVNFAVAMFIFLSGYLTKTEIPDVKVFMAKRLKRVLIPYLIWSVIYLVPQKFDGFIVKLLTGSSCGIYYYIFVYIQFVILTPLIIKLVKSKYRWVGYIITPLSTIVLRYVLIISGNDFIGTEYKYLFTAWFIYYYLGIILGNNLIKVKKKPAFFIALYSIFILLSFGEGLFWYNYGNVDMTTSQLRLTSLGISIIVIMLSYFYLKSEKSLRCNAVNKILLLIGDASFGIYLSHMLILKFAKLLPVWKYAIFPINSIIILTISLLCVLIGKKLLKKNSWLLGL